MFAATDNGKEPKPSTSLPIENPQPCRPFEFPEILRATNKFDESLVIGQGGFGKVYKGDVSNGSSVSVAAIKRLDFQSGQGAAEFWAEVEMLTKLRHCHLVSLFGYCNYEKEMILIYEYMPNGTLEDHLHKLGTPLSWVQRLRICVGAARGLDYLHTGTGIDTGVIHRDVKTSNILLHESWAAKISDFGLSKIGPTNQSLTYVNTLVKGTFGYLDPDYFFTGRLTRKSDVYAFGVVLLEVLCRKRAVDESLDEVQWNLARWAQESIKEGNIKNIIDSGIRGEISPKSLRKFVQMTERCLHNNPKRRPTMAEVVVGLQSVLILQEKKNSSLQPVDKTIFGRMFLKLPFPSNSRNEDLNKRSQKPVLTVLTESVNKSLTLGELIQHEVQVSVIRPPGDSNQSSNSKANIRNSVGDIVQAGNKYLTTPISSLRVFKLADFGKEYSSGNFKRAPSSKAFGLAFIGLVDKDTFTPLTQGVGTAVAIKYYPGAHPEWQTQVTMLARLSHQNIIGLLGYCDDEEECWLVYKHTQNPNLSHFLFKGDEDFSKPLSWGNRLIILIGVARGLAYIHSSIDQVVHGDVNTSNILLDENFEAKLGFFGLETFGSEGGKIITTSCITGTPPNQDPENKTTCQQNLKCDIFSFGVVLLETLTGEQATKHDDESGMVKWASQFLTNESELKKIMDPRLKQNYPLEDAFKCASLASRCVAMDCKDRPSSEEVLQSLEQIYVATNNEYGV